MRQQVLLTPLKWKGNFMLTTASFIFAYIAGIVICNLGFELLPFINTPLGVLPVMSAFVGLIFILRDFVQRRVGHMMVIPIMLVGVAITWLTVSPELAIASASAFAISEFVDWIVYTYTGKKFEDRVLISSAISTPIDSIVFLALIGFLSPGAVIIMTASKMLVSVLMWAAWKWFNVERRVGASLGVA